MPIRRTTVKYTVIFIITIIVLFLFQVLHDINLIGHHVLIHLFIFLFSIAFISFAAVSLLFLIRRIINPINVLIQILKDMSLHNFTLSKTNRTLLRKLSSHNDEIGTLANAFLTFERISKKKLNQLEKNIRQREKLENALSIAHDIQLSLLPQVPGTLEHPNIDLYALLESTEKIGGDWYDFSFLDNSSLFFVLGDVSDKAISAALFMAIIKTHISSIIEFEKDPARIVSLLNKKLRQNNPHYMFVTLFLGILNIKTGELHYINAGHCTPILLQQNKPPIFLRESYQPIIGVLKDVNYYARKIMLNPNDILFIYSDGIIEARDQLNQMYSDEKLLDYLIKVKHRKARTLIRSVYTEIKHRLKPTDDISMLAVSIKQKIHKGKSWLTLPSSLDSLNQLTSFVHSHLNEYPININRKNEIILAIEELFINIVENAYTDGNFGLVSIGFERRPSKVIQIQLSDYGNPFNPARYIREKKISKEITKRGHGLQLVRNFCDKIEYKRIQDKNFVTLEFS